MAYGENGTYYRNSVLAIDSSVAASTTMLTGKAGYCTIIKNITAYKSTGSTQTFYIKLQTTASSSFDTDTLISQDNDSDKEMSGQEYYISGNDERIQIVVSGAVASSVIDVGIYYVEMYEGEIY